MAQHPRNMRDWMRTQERKDSQRAAPALIRAAIENVKEETGRETTRHPAAPVELSHQTSLYLDTRSRWAGRLILNFPPVVFNTDGTPTLIRQYELWGRDETPEATPGYGLGDYGAGPYGVPPEAEQEPAEEPAWAVRGTSSTPFFRSEEYKPGSLWRFRVRAIGVSSVEPGEWSEEFTAQFLVDTTPPPQPSAPQIVAERGQLIVTWDGQSVNGPMPGDFLYAQLAHGDTASPEYEVARFGRDGGIHVITGIDYYDPQYVRLRAVDESGNWGPWSQQGVGYTTPLVDKDVILSQIDAAKTHLINIDAGVSILENTIIAEHLVATESLTAKFAQFLYLAADKIDVNSLAADEVFTGLLDAVLVRADMFEGRMFTGGRFIGTTFETNVEANRGLKWSTAGLEGYSPSGVLTLGYDSATGEVSVVGKISTSTEGERVDIGARTWQSRPGVQLVTGPLPGGYYPTLYAVSQNPEPTTAYPAGVMALMGQETTANSSGRSELVLYPGGDFVLEQLWGAYGGIGIRKTADTIQLRGRMPMSDQLQTTQFYIADAWYTGQISPGSIATMTQSVVPPRHGQRRWMVSARGNSVSGAGMTAWIMSEAAGSVTFTVGNNGSVGVTGYGYRLLGVLT